MARIQRSTAYQTVDSNLLREKLEQLLPLIRQVADFVGRQCGLSVEEREDLVSDICLKLIQKDYEKLRQFEGRAKLTTYLKTVVVREAIDHYRRQHGKIRPAARSRERGDWACRYERLRRNEGRTRQEALAILESEGVLVPREQLDALDGEIAARRPPRTFESTDGLFELPANDPNPEQRALTEERQAQRRQLLLALRRALRDLTPEDRAFLRLYCEPTARARAKQLAAMFGSSVTEVYRRYQELCKDLRRRLREMGIDAEEVKTLLAEIRGEGENA